MGISFSKFLHAGLLLAEFGSGRVFLMASISSFLFIRIALILIVFFVGLAINPIENVEFSDIAIALVLPFCQCWIGLPASSVVILPSFGRKRVLTYLQ